MGRSVSVPLNAVGVFYKAWTQGHEDEETGEPIADDDFDYWESEWDYLVHDDFVGNVLTDLFPSVEPADYWIGTEDHVVAENQLAAFGVSEYCGLAAFWVVVKDNSNWDLPSWTGLAAAWIDKAWPKVEAMYPSRLGLMGRFSNGGAVYKRVTGSDATTGE